MITPCLTGAHKALPHSPDLTLNAPTLTLTPLIARHYYGYLSHSLAMNTTVPLLHLLAFAYSGDMVLPLPMGLGRLANYVLGECGDCGSERQG